MKRTHYLTVPLVALAIGLSIGVVPAFGFGVVVVGVVVVGVVVVGVVVVGVVVVVVLVGFCAAAA